jgi:hypothetical protein
VERQACLDFLVQVLAGPNAGRTWGGDLIMAKDQSGFFTAALVPASEEVRRTLTVTDPSTVICEATGQQNGAAVVWFLYCDEGRIFGSGLIDTVRAEQELRGITAGPADGDTGVFHGSNRPPYIRQTPPDRP